MIQVIITRKCNFLCGHCMWSCIPSGRHMPLSIFKKTLPYIERAGGVNIVGGEPTIHPLFSKILFSISDISLSKQSIRVVTNGSWILSKPDEIIETLSVVSKKIGKENIFVRISNDRYHRKFIKEALIFKAEKLLKDNGIRTCAKRMDDAALYPLGRARRLKLYAYQKMDQPAECTKLKYYNPWDSLSIDIDGSVSICSLHQAAHLNILRSSQESLLKELYKIAAATVLRNPRVSDCHRCHSILL